MNKILTVSGNKVVINEIVLSIPELKAVYDHYCTTEDKETAILALSYLHWRYDPESPYHNISEDVMDETIRKDFRGRYNPKFDEVMINACRKIEEFESPVARVVEALKISMDNISVYLKTTELSTGRDGNLTEVLRAHKEMPIILKNFRSTVKDFMAETIKNRSNSKNAIDENDENEHF